MGRDKDTIVVVDWPAAILSFAAGLLVGLLLGLSVMMGW
jgi:hypothetical protein